MSLSFINQNNAIVHFAEYCDRLAPTLICLQTLEKEHMLNHNLDTATTLLSNNYAAFPCNEAVVDVLQHSATVPQDRNTADTTFAASLNDNAMDHAAANVETGIVRGLDPPEREYHEEEEQNEEGQYSQILIPMPGHNFDCVDLYGCDEVKKDPTGKEESEKKSRRIKFFGVKDKSLKDVNDEPTKELELTTPPRAKGGKRICPIFYAICLAEYKTSKRVSWSSSPDCTPAFHEDCVVEWLVSLGRTKSKNVQFAEEPTDDQLFNYQLECPCCRQNFIVLKVFSV